MDKLTPEQRSHVMARVRNRDTKPELAVRSLLHRMGYRFRLHRRDLPGTPDIVFPARKKVVFVHGCFWHGHTCNRGRLPETNRDSWKAKIAANRARDKAAIRNLHSLGWAVLTVWECEIRSELELLDQLSKFLEAAGIEEAYK